MATSAESIAEDAGVARALAMYYGPGAGGAALTAFYAEFIGRGALCFDVGANVGSRVAAWLPLGARVVAVEPLPACLHVLRRLYGGRDDVHVVAAAVGAASGRATLRVCRTAPTVSSLSPDWPELIRRRDPAAREEWAGTVEVRVTTLDALIRRFGAPAFAKIDVEGWEAPVLAGLSRPLPALSFEYVPGATERALACLERLLALGAYEFNVVVGEGTRLELPGWVDAGRLAAWLGRRRLEDPPGDVYARLRHSPR